MNAAEAVQISLPPLTGPQIAIWKLDELDDVRCVDVEGSPRSAKSWGIGFWIWKLVYTYPGIQIFYCRYKDDDLKTLRDVWDKVRVYFPVYLHPRWNTEFDSWDFPNKSRVYISSLRVSEGATADAIHGKYKGRTLAIVICEEAQEIPKSNYRGLKERLSQSKTPEGKDFDYPLKIVLVHNSVDKDHWIAKEFPLGADGETCTVPGHLHLRADLYSNRNNLGPKVIAGFEQDYPVGHPLRATVLEGRRGVTYIGEPVYRDSFKRLLHMAKDVRQVPHDRFYPLCEGWDFGKQKPAVVWAQYIRHLAAFRILGAVKGSDLFLEMFAPKVLEIRRRWFGRDEDLDILTWCDPTGATGNGGLSTTPVSLLHAQGVLAQPAMAGTRDGNDPEIRDLAIQTLGGYMHRKAIDGSEAFLVAPRCVEISLDKDGHWVEEESSVLVEAFESGYHYPEKVTYSDAHPNIRRPQKGTRFDDLMNALEYIVTGAQIPSAPSVGMLSAATAQYQRAPEREQLRKQMEAARALRLQQRDRDPADRSLRTRTNRRGIM